MEKKLYLLLIIFTSNLSIQTESNESLSYNSLKKRESDLDQNLFDTSQQKELEKLHSEKKTITTEYDTNKEKITKELDAIMNKRRTSHEKSKTEAQQGLSEEELKKHQEFYESTNEKLTEENNSKLELLKIEYDKNLAAITNDITNLEEKHYQENVKFDKSRAQLEKNFARATIFALNMQIEYLQKIKSDHVENFLKNQPNTRKHEHTKAAFSWYDWWHNNLFELTADEEETTCTQCLDTQGNIAIGLLNNPNISQETKEALQFMARIVQHVQPGFATQIDPVNKVEAIKVGYDLRYRFKDSEKLVNLSEEEEKNNEYTS